MTISQRKHYVRILFMFHSRTKHIDVRHHFIRDVINLKLISVEYLLTDRMTADILTKPLVKEKYEKFVSELYLKES